MLADLRAIDKEFKKEIYEHKYQEKCEVYEDEGNTETSGTEYNYTWLYPLIYMSKEDLEYCAVSLHNLKYAIAATLEIKIRDEDCCLKSISSKLLFGTYDNPWEDKQYHPIKLSWSWSTDLTCDVTPEKVVFLMKKIKELREHHMLVLGVGQHKFFKDKQ